MVELKVNPGELAAGGRGLEEAAKGIPEPLAPFTSTGTDALSTILSTLTQEKEAPLITGLPATKAEALATARNIVTAAGMYERSDQQIATDVRNASARVDSVSGASSASGAGSAGGASQVQQLMNTPMQVAQQVGQVAQSVGQLPQGVMQGVQQIGQVAGGAGQSADVRDVSSEKSQDDEKLVEPAPEEGAAAGSNGSERAPAAPSPRHARPEPGIVV